MGNSESNFKVEGCQYYWDSSRGILVLSNATQNVRLKVKAAPNRYNLVYHIEGATIDSSNSSSYIETHGSGQVKFDLETGYKKLPLTEPITSPTFALKEFRKQSGNIYSFNNDAKQCDMQDGETITIDFGMCEEYMHAVVYQPDSITDQNLKVSYNKDFGAGMTPTDLIPLRIGNNPNVVKSHSERMFVVESIAPHCHVFDSSGQSYVTIFRAGTGEREQITLGQDTPDRGYFVLDGKGTNDENAILVTVYPKFEEYSFYLNMGRPQQGRLDYQLDDLPINYASNPNDNEKISFSTIHHTVKLFTTKFNNSSKIWMPPVDISHFSNLRGIKNLTYVYNNSNDNLSPVGIMEFDLDDNLTFPAGNVSITIDTVDSVHQIFNTLHHVSTEEEIFSEMHRTEKLVIDFYPMSGYAIENPNPQTTRGLSTEEIVPQNPNFKITGAHYDWNPQMRQLTLMNPFDDVIIWVEGQVKPVPKPKMIVQYSCRTEKDGMDSQIMHATTHVRINIDQGDKDFLKVVYGGTESISRQTECDFHESNEESHASSFHLNVVVYYNDELISQWTPDVNARIEDNYYYDAEVDKT